jgi:hypothetical protein
VSLAVVPSAGGRALVGQGAVTFTVAGDLAPLLPAALPSPFADDAQPFAGRLVGAERGTGVVTADGAGAHAEVLVAVVAPSALARVALTDGQLAVPHDVTATVGLTAFADAGEPVYGASCTWTVEPPGLLIRAEDLDRSVGSNGDDSEEPPAPLDGPPVTTYHLAGPPGHYTATCTAGALSAILTVDAE